MIAHPCVRNALARCQTTKFTRRTISCTYNQRDLNIFESKICLPHVDGSSDPSAQSKLIHSILFNCSSKTNPTSMTITTPCLIERNNQFLFNILIHHRSLRLVYKLFHNETDQLGRMMAQNLNNLVRLPLMDSLH